MPLQFDAEGFRKAIKTKRIIDLEIDLRQLSDKVKVNHSTIWRIENGGMPTLQHFAALCEWLGQEVPFHKKSKK